MIRIKYIRGLSVLTLAILTSANSCPATSAPRIQGAFGWEGPEVEQSPDAVGGTSAKKLPSGPVSAYEGFRGSCVIKSEQMPVCIEAYYTSVYETDARRLATAKTNCANGLLGTPGTFAEGERCDTKSAAGYCLKSEGYAGVTNTMVMTINSAKVGAERLCADGVLGGKFFAVLPSN